MCTRLAFDGKAFENFSWTVGIPVQYEIVLKFQKLKIIYIN